MDGVARENADLDAATAGIAFMVVSILIWRRTQAGEVAEQARPHFLGNRVEDSDHLQIDEQPIFHEAGLLGIPLLQLIEFDPMRGVSILDFPGQGALKILVLLGLLRNEESDQLTLLGRRQMSGLIFELRQRHAENATQK
jgi:hypothetical protein